MTPVVTPVLTPFSLSKPNVFFLCSIESQVLPGFVLRKEKKKKQHSTILKSNFSVRNCSRDFSTLDFRLNPPVEMSRWLVL